MSGRNVANNQFTGWIPEELENINDLEWVLPEFIGLNALFSSFFITFEFFWRTGGNSWSSGPAPPPPPGQKSHSHAKHSNNKKPEGSGGMSGEAIAGIVLGVLVILGIIIALFSRRSSKPSSHFLEEDRLSQHRPFTPLASQELSSDLYTDRQKSFKGEHTSLALFLHSSIWFSLSWFSCFPFSPLK